MSGPSTPTNGPGAATGLRAVVLAGGRGVRLRPFTVNFPKPLVPLGDEPVVEVLIRRLLAFGITDITLSLGHLAELIKAYFHHRRQLTSQCDIRFVEEEAPTGTAGSLALVPDLSETFRVMNGDLLTDLDFHELVAFHRKQGAALTVATHQKKVKVDLGVLEFGDDHRVREYFEKPEHCYNVSMGIYVYEPQVLGFIEPGAYLDFPDLVLKLIRAGEPVCAYPSDCLWLDIGRPDDYAKAQESLAKPSDGFDHV
jgi:NDP-sugar pyrophosphorylase family protein